MNCSLGRGWGCHLTISCGCILQLHSYPENAFCLDHQKCMLLPLTCPKICFWQQSTGKSMVMNPCVDAALCVKIHTKLFNLGHWSMSYIPSCFPAPWMDGLWMTLQRLTWSVGGGAANRSATATEAVRAGLVMSVYYVTVISCGNKLCFNMIFMDQWIGKWYTLDFISKSLDSILS